MTKLWNELGNVTKTGQIHYTPKTRIGDDGTVYYYRNVRTQAAMVTLDCDGKVIAIVGGLGEKNKSLSLNRAYSVTRQTGSTIKMCIRDRCITWCRLPPTTATCWIWTTLS